MIKLVLKVQPVAQAAEVVQQWQLTGFSDPALRATVEAASAAKQRLDEAYIANRAAGGTGADGLPYHAPSIRLEWVFG